MSLSIENRTKSDSDFGPTFVDHYLFLDTKFNGLYLIKIFLSLKK